MNIPIRRIFSASVSYLKRKVRKVMKKITLEIETNRPKRIWIHKKYPEELSHNGNGNENKFKNVKSANENMRHQNILNKEEILISAKMNIKKMLNENSDDIDVYIATCARILDLKEVEKLVNYVEDLEKITLLMHSLGRRLASAQLKIFRHQKIHHQEDLCIKSEKLATQLSDAENIKNFIDKKLGDILEVIEIKLGNHSTIDFKLLLETKVKLIITLKEIEDKIKLLNSSLGPFSPDKTKSTIH